MARPFIDFRPGTLDLKGVRANDRNMMRIHITNGGVAMNMTGAVLSAQARATRQDPKIAVEAEIIEIDESQGVYILRWPGVQIADALAGAETWDGVWDLQALSPGETEPETLLEGMFLAEADVTRTPL